MQTICDLLRLVYFLWERKDLILYKKNRISWWFGNSSGNTGNEASQYHDLDFCKDPTHKRSHIPTMSLGWSKARVVETMEATVFLKFRQKTTQPTTQMCTYNPFVFSILLLKSKRVLHRHSQFGLGFIILSDNYTLQLVLKLGELLSIEIIKAYHSETQTASH